MCFKSKKIQLNLKVKKDPLNNNGVINNSDKKQVFNYNNHNVSYSKMDKTCNGDQMEDTHKDELTTAIGEFGRWHKLLMVGMFVPAKISVIWTQIAIIFFAPKTIFHCTERLQGSLHSNLTINSTCYSDCSKYEYYSNFDSTIISEWDLVCDRGWLANFTQIMCMFGLLVGSMIFGYQSDRFGRRPAFLTACTLLSASSWIITFYRNLWIFTILRFLQGMSLGGTMLIPHIIMIEIIGPQKRELVNTVSLLPVTVGHMSLSLLAFYFRSWDQICLGIAVLNTSLLLLFFYVPESPKWLIISGQLDKACEVMKRAAKCNGLPTDTIPEVAERIFKLTTSKKGQIRASYTDLITKPSWRYKNISSCACWFLLGLTFYGFNQYIGQTSDNVFATVALAGAFQIPGILISGLCCKYFGRRKTLIAYLMVATVSIAMLAFSDNWWYVKLIVGSIGISATTGAFCTMYLYTTEIFPTVVRNMAIGASSTASRIGSMLAPLVAGLTGAGLWVPPTVFSVAPLISAVVCYFLPETRGLIVDE